MGYDGNQVREMLQRACKDAGSQFAWAQGHGVKPPYVSAVLRGKADPGAQILRALGLRRRVVYETIEPVSEVAE